MATNVKRKKKAEVMPDDGNMTLTGHLKELRNRLIVCAVVFVAAVVVTLAYADRLIDLLTAMGQGFYTFVSIAPQEKLMQYFRVSLLAAVVVTVPVALYQMYAFAKPGLKKSETFFLKLVILPVPQHRHRGCRLHPDHYQYRELCQPLPDHVHHLWLCV